MPSGMLQHLVHDLLGRLLDDGSAAVGAMRLTDAGPEEAHVVVDLGYRGYRRARVAAGGFLIDGDRGRKPLDSVQVGLVHLAEELARVSGKRLDVAPLPLGIDGIEGQGGLARAGEAGDDHQLVPGDFDRDVFEVVLPRTADD